MNILLNGLTLRPGGGLVVLEGLVSGIARVAAEVSITVIAYDETVYRSLADLELANVEIIKAPKINDVIDKLLVALRVRKAVLDFGCDVLLTLNFFVPVLPVPQIVYHVDMERFEYHSIFPPTLHNLFEKIRDKSAERALKRANANVFESNFLLKTAQEYSGVRINQPSVIYIGINESTIVPAGTGLGDIAEGLIVTVTNPLKYKNNYAMVPLLQELKKREPDVDWKIRVFGGKDLSVWSELIEIAHASNVADNFEFMGYQNRDVLNESLDSAICLFNASRLESFCMVAVEAMARGCPVIVSADAAMPESVGDAGLIIDPDDTMAIVDKILQLRSDFEFRLSIKKQSLDWVEQLTWNQSGSAFYELFSNLSTA